MSTKIYHGVAWPAGDVWETVAKVRSSIDAAVRPKYQKAVSGLFASVKAEPVREERAQMMRDGMAVLDESLDDVCVVLIPNGSGRVLAMPFGWPAEQSMIETEMILAGAEEYGYWDNVDPPSELAEAEWSERRRVWSAALHGFGAPARHGVIVEPGFSLADLAYGEKPPDGE